MRSKIERQKSRKMNSDHELYSGFEPDANEIMFGQRTLPDRPLTANEVSKRKRIILKLVDQKLKIELIGLMSRHEQQTNKSNANSVTTAWTMPSNYSRPQNVCQQSYPSGPVYPQQNGQPQLENVWQLPIYPQQYTMHDNTAWSHLGYNSQPNHQLLEQHQNRINKSPLHPSHQQPNPNSIYPSTKSLTTSTTCTTDKTSTTDYISRKKSRWEPIHSVHSVRILHLLASLVCGKRYLQIGSSINFVILSHESFA